ncbi:unnamed protein product [Ixodes hexagonus]
MKQRDKLYATFIKTRCPEYLAEFKKVRNKLGSDIKQVRSIYYENKFASIYNNPRNVWRTVNDLMSKNDRRSISELIIEGVSCTGTVLASQFNDHFLMSGASNISDKDGSDYEFYVASNNESSIFYIPLQNRK